LNDDGSALIQSACVDVAGGTAEQGKLWFPKAEGVQSDEPAGTLPVKC
jgi:hypothetical protein